jgi:23S rRNA pseudouridine1911/1915/1917 synthase
MVTEGQQFQVESGLGRIRLDDYLFARFGSLSRMYLRDLVRTNQVIVNGDYPNIGTRLRANDFIEMSVDMSRGTSMQPEDIPLDIVYEDGAVIVVNKPAGMLVHPTHRDKNGTLLNALTFYLNKKDLTQSRKDAETVRPGLVHRLDKGTSGLMVIAKSVATHRKLAREFMKKRVKKRYVALVDGVIAENEGEIESRIGRYAEKKIWDVKEDGKSAVSRFCVLDRFTDSTLVELEPVTGRTNQLRIHCASIGHPIVGDVQRGGREFARLCLHAFWLSFKHPLAHSQVEFNTDIPKLFWLTDSMGECPFLPDR